MTFKAMQGVDFKNMIFLVFWAKKLTIECAFKTDLAGFYMYPVATPLLLILKIQRHQKYS
jgi:hypothetical protein